MVVERHYQRSHRQTRNSILWDLHWKRSSMEISARVIDAPSFRYYHFMKILKRNEFKPVSSFISIQSSQVSFKQHCIRKVNTGTRNKIKSHANFVHRCPEKETSKCVMCKLYWHSLPMQFTKTSFLSPAKHFLKMKRKKKRRIKLDIKWQSEKFNWNFHVSVQCLAEYIEQKMIGAIDATTNIRLSLFFCFFRHATMRY